MEAKDLVRLYERSHGVLQANLRDITDEDSHREPPGGANSINRVLGHIVMSRGGALQAVGAEPVWDSATAGIYSGEEGVVFERARALPLERLLADLETTQARLLPPLAALTAEKLAAPIRTTDVGDFLTFLAYHEGYHAGQLGILRRLVGKAGVIKQPKAL